MLNALIQKSLNMVGGKLFALFVDFRRAFPSVVHRLLWMKLSRFGISGKFIRILMSLYENATMKIKSAIDVSEGVRVTEGVLQGEVLSPLLFAIFIADFEDFLRGRGVRGIVINRMIRILMLAYADDIVIFAETWKEMETLLVFLEEYCQINQLQINPAKTKVVIFRKGGRNYKKLAFSYGTETISISPSYEYLGVVFDSRGSFQKAANAILSKASKASASSRNLIMKAKVNDILKINNLFGSLVSSIVNHGCPIWGLKHLDTIEKLQTGFYKKLFLLPPNTPNYAVRNEFGRAPLACKIFKLSINWIGKVLEMDGDRLPRIALDILLSINDNQNSLLNYNWLGNLKKSFLEPIGEDWVLEDLECLREEGLRQDLICKFFEFRRSEDINKCFESSSLLLYPSLSLGERLFLRLKKTIHEKAFISQLRLLNRYNCRIILRGKIYALSSNMTCYYCNFSNLNVSHFLFECPLLEELRDSLNFSVFVEEEDKIVWGLSPENESVANSLEKMFVNLCTNQLSEFVTIH